MAKIDESSQMYVYFKKAKGPTFPLLKLNEKYRCEKHIESIDDDKIKVRLFVNYYDTTYYYMSLERFEEHFLTIKQYRKLKLKKINEVSNL